MSQKYISKYTGSEIDAILDEALAGVSINGIPIVPENRIISITIDAEDVGALPDSTKFTAGLNLTIDPSTFVMTIQLIDQDGNDIGDPKSLDLPLEELVVSGTYDGTNKKIVLTLKSGDTIEIPVGDLVSGLQTELSADNKLNPAFINWGTTYASVSQSEKDTYAGKQDALTFDNTPTAGSSNPVKSGGIKTELDKKMNGKASGTTTNHLMKFGSDGYTVEDAGASIEIDTLSTQDNTKVPTNKAVASFVNSSVATNTANFVGTYKSLAELEAVQNPTNNDYGFVSSVDSAILTTTQPDDWTTNYTDYYTKSGNTYIPVTGSSAPTWQANTYWKADNLIFKRYKYNSSTTSWSYEYELNNSSYTASEWATIQSGLTSGDKEKIDSLANIKSVGSGLSLNDSAGELTADVTGIKGDSESNYRTGNVNITKSNIGLGNVTNNAQVKKISSSTSGNIMTWSGTTGDTPADSGVSIETSSSGISDSDAKIPTSKDIRNNVAGSAKLTGYAKTTGDVGSTDTITAAIGKLETKADNNTTNFGKVQAQANWNTNNGVKNLLPINNATDTTLIKIPIVLSSGTFTLSIDNLTSAATGEGSRCCFMNGDNAVSSIEYLQHTSNISATFTITATCDSLWIYAGGAWSSSDGKSLSITNAMLAPKSLYDSDSTYEPYALPNSTLTQQTAFLEELNGAKNLAPYNSGEHTGNASYWFLHPNCIDIAAGTSLYLVYDYTQTDGQISIQLTDSNGNIISGTSSYSTQGTTSGHKATKITVPSGKTAKGYNAYHSANATVTASNFMIIPAEIYDAGFSEYQPYALPNTKITPELIELVDSGAKNLSTATGGTVSDGGFPIDDTLITIPVGTYVVSFNGTVTSGRGSLNFKDSNGQIISGQGIVFDLASKVEQEFSITANNIVKFNLYSNRANTITNFMICTKAAWDVSQKYAPYRPTYEETVEQVTENKNNISTFVTPTAGDITFNDQLAQVPTVLTKYITQSGKTVNIQLYLDLGTAPTADAETVIGTLTGIDAPKNLYRGFCMVAAQYFSSDFETCFVGIATTKNLYIKPKTGTTNTKYMINITYQTN